MSRRRAIVLAHHLGALALGLGGWAALRRFGPALSERLEAMDLVLSAPGYLWALLAIPALLVLRAHTLSDLPRAQQALSLLLRTGFVLALVAALVGVEEVAHEPVSTATVFVVDASASMPDAALEQARARVEDAWQKRGEGEVRLVVFGREAHEVPLGPPPGAGASAPAVPELTRLPGDEGLATDVQAGLRLAESLLPEGRLGRLVLVTDGLETRGALSEEEATARRFGVRVHHLDLSDLPRPAELMVTGLSAPKALEPRVPFVARATVRATGAMAARCELFVDGVLAEGQDVALAPGDTEVAIEARVKEGGDKRLSVQCAPKDPDQDRFPSNNRFEVPIHVKTLPKVLYVEGERQLRQNLVSALGHDFDVELRDAHGVPSSAADARQFDLIFISDVPRVGGSGGAYMTRDQMQVLESYARDGGGLVFAGGESSFGPGGYGGTWLEEHVLPVELDVEKKEDVPSLALMLVIDRSGSMTGDKIELAKEAARATLDALQPSDKLGIIAFDSAPTVVVRLQRAANRLKITDNLARLSPSGGTNIRPALVQAYRALAGTQAKVKHIILLTDGQSTRTGILELVSQSSADKITISTVAVGLNSDQELMMRVAEEGGGRYYFTDRAENIPKLFLKETSEVTRRALVEDPFRPVVARRFRNLQMFKGTGIERAPPLLGYVSTRAKPRAEVLMLSNHDEPILARWRLGLGQVVVWTSDVKNKWAHFWLAWPGYAQFWRQLVRDTLRVEREDPAMQTLTDIADGVLTVGVDAVDAEDRFIDGLESQMTVTGPDGQDREVTLAQTAPGRYEGTLALDAYGPWTVRGSHHAPEPEAPVHRSYAAVAWPFPTEHLLGPPDLSAVRALSEATGGTAAPTNAQLFDTEGRTTERREPRWQPPLYLALILLLLDVLLRRVRLYGNTSIPWRTAKP
ncbi:MAG: VWA domain-containing protein [Deltaproteobacteria bacterium]|nr:VWA domain-containing protein [Deltaproteobacteria bacterium]MCB9787451.1 VWA domain-containing protein [Deltaproteobacteria bacterium]